MSVETPFIKLLKTPRFKYFYDVGKNEIIRISEELFADLEMVEKGELSWEELSSSPDEELFSLLEDGYLSTNRVKHIRHPLSDLCSTFMDRKLEKITLQVTQECNFRCKYCIYSENTFPMQRTHSSKHMTWETAKQAVDFFFRHSIDSKSRNIGFYGGEPLLRFDLIRKVIEYAEEHSKGKQLSFNITTNGSLLSLEVIQYLAEHSVNTLLSLDGNKAVQDKNRVFANGTGTFDVIAARLEAIKQSFPEYYQRIQVNSVMSPDNDIDDILCLPELFQGITANRFLTNYVEYSESEFSPTFDFYKKTEYQRMLAFLAFCGRYPVDRLSSMGNNWLSDLRSSIDRFRESAYLPETFAPGGPCLPGKSRLLITADGQFFPCERVNESAHMRIGNLTNGFDFEAINRLLNIGSLTEERCKTCWAIRRCSICAKMCDDGEKLSADRKLRYCENSKTNAETTLRRIIFCRELESGVYLRTEQIT